VVFERKDRARPSKSIGEGNRHGAKNSLERRVLGRVLKIKHAKGTGGKRKSVQKISREGLRQHTNCQGSRSREGGAGGRKKKSLGGKIPALVAFRANLALWRLGVRERFQGQSLRTGDCRGGHGEFWRMDRTITEV